MFINSGQKGAVEGWPCLRAAAWGCRRWEADSPCPVAGQPAVQRARGPAGTALVRGNGESNVGTQRSGVCRGTGNNKL